MGETAKTGAASRRAFLTGTLAAGGTVAATSLARAAGDPAIVELPAWSQELGEGVDARPYGSPSQFESHVVRRNVPWLTADAVSSVNFTPLHEMDGIITPNGLCFERHHAGIAELDPGVETIVHKLDVRPGGLWLGEMQWGGNSHYQRVEYTEVIPPERLVWLHAVSDGDWNVIPNPMMADWPRVLLTTVTFDAEGDKTKLRLTWVPHKASEAETACFAGAIAGLDKGWGAGMELLAELLAELQA